MSADLLWLQAHGQRLGLVPQLGGGVAAWQWVADAQPVDLWRRWDERSGELNTLASFAMLPWSNRISGGGFEHAGRFHPIRPNRDGEPYPIHGDGWLQPWTVAEADAERAVLHLRSRRFDGNPYDYDAEQTFCLVDGGLDQSLRITHRGDEPLPYGLGLHPWFTRTPRVQLRARVRGLWLGRSDRLPTQHTTRFPPGWDLRTGAPMHGGDLIDNGYTGWDGDARIEWPEHGLAVEVHMPPVDTPEGLQPQEYCLVYRPGTGPAFCFEPITQPIDAFHLPGQPGLVTLAQGQTLGMSVRWRVVPLPR